MIFLLFHWHWRLNNRLRFNWNLRVSLSKSFTGFSECFAFQQFLMSLQKIGQIKKGSTASERSECYLLENLSLLAQTDRNVNFEKFKYWKWSFEKSQFRMIISGSGHKIDKVFFWNLLLNCFPRKFQPSSLKLFEK